MSIWTARLALRLCSSELRLAEVDGGDLGLGVGLGLGVDLHLRRHHLGQIEWQSAEATKELRQLPGRATSDLVAA